MKFGVVVFPGSNCDHDCYHVAKHVMGQSAQFLWHGNDTVEDVDCVILPGGFSYGDYLRSGAIARFSPVMGAVKRFAESGGLVLGICNGFQILLEAGLLEGAMMRNKSLKFVCKDVYVRLENADTPLVSAGEAGRVYNIPIAHADGNYVADPETLKRIEDNGQVVFRYVSPKGETGAEYNPNGSVNNIAGIRNARGNVMGMMPHPERVCEDVLGNTAGRFVFDSIIKTVTAGLAPVK